jgi:hypothetical protein
VFFAVNISRNNTEGYNKENMSIFKKKIIMKKILAIAFLGLGLGLTAQTIESSSHSTTGYVKSDGTIENSSHSTKGYIKNDGTIENSSHSTIGYIKSDGTIENSSHSTVGYVKKDGTVENSSHSTIGHADGVKREWAAVVFFFFKF